MVRAMGYCNGKGNGILQWLGQCDIVMVRVLGYCNG